MPDDAPEPEFSNDAEHQRYEWRVDGELAAIAEYDLRPGRIVFTHTEVDPRFEGRGIAGRLAKAALGDARARALEIVPQCPYIAEYIRRHPEALDDPSPPG